MRAVVQRVIKAKVEVNGDEIASIGRGLLVLLGIAKDDEKVDAEYLACKIENLRVFDKPEKSLVDLGLPVLVVSQFTLLADTKKGKRPSFSDAAEPILALDLFNYFVTLLRSKKIEVETGSFGAIMQVGLINDGPFTLVLDSKQG